MFTKDDTKMIKGIAVMLMLFHHLFTFPERIFNDYVDLNIKGYSVSALIGSFGKICVMIFIFLAGYGIYLSLLKDNEDNVMKKRISNLYKLFWQVFIIFVPICIIFKKINFNIIDIILNFVGFKLSFNGEWWFLAPYIILILFSPLIFKLFKKLNLSGSIVLVIFANVICLEIIPIIQRNSWTSLLYGNQIFQNIHLTLNLLSGFLMGMLCAKYDIISYFKNKYSNNYLYVIVSIFGLLVLFYVRLKLDYLYDYIYAPIFIIFVTIILSTKNKLLSNVRKFTIKVGNESTIIWLVHSFYCYTLCQKFIFMPKLSVLIFGWLLLLSYTTSLVIKYIFYKLGIIYKKLLLKLEVK